MLVRQVWKDPRLKKICDIEANEPPYGIAVLSRFRSKVGPERLTRVVDQAVEVLVEKGIIKSILLYEGIKPSLSPGLFTLKGVDWLHSLKFESIDSYL